MATQVMPENRTITVCEGGCPMAPALRWLDRCANLAILPCMAVLSVGAYFLSLPWLWSGTAALGVCLIAKIAAFVPHWKANGSVRSR